MARRRRGRVVRQRPAKPRTAVRVRSAPLFQMPFLNRGMAAGRPLGAVATGGLAVGRGLPLAFATGPGPGLGHLLSTLTTLYDLST